MPELVVGEEAAAGFNIAGIDDCLLLLGLMLRPTEYMHEGALKEPGRHVVEEVKTKKAILTLKVTQ